MALTTIDDRGLTTPIDLLDNEQIRFGTGNDLKLYHDATNSVINNTTGDLYIKSIGGVFITPGTTEAGVYIRHNGAVELYHDNVKKFETYADGAKVHKYFVVSGLEAGDSRIYMAADEGDDNADWWLMTADTSNVWTLKNLASGSYETNIECNGNGNVELYHNNVKKFETASDGVAVTGDVTITNTGSNPQLALIAAADGTAEIQFGDANDAVRANIIYKAGSAGDALCFNGYNNTERMRIDSAGRLLIATTSTSGISAGADDVIIGSIGDGTNRGLTFATTADASIRWADAGDNAMGKIQYSNSTDVMTIHTSNATQLRIDSDGLKFGSDSAAANGLSDYEEGTWTPGVTFGGNSSGQSFDGNSGGSYTKIGRMVHIHGRIEFTDKGSSTGNAKIKDLPFAAANVTSGNSSIEGGFYFTYESNIMSGEDRASILGYITQGSDKVELYFRNDSGDINAITNSDFEDTTNLSFEGQYPAA
jgi:hypothetical protein